jgi:uncharacterized membrane protein (DUF4010 family)
VVAVSAISYGSYVIQKLRAGRGGLIFAAILGGAYSSTVTTVVLAKRSTHDNHTHLISGATLVACGLMYLRIIALLALFNRDLMKTVAPSFALLALGGVAGGWLWSKRKDPDGGKVTAEYAPQNPLELRAAFLFAALFLAMLIATHAAASYLGKTGVYSLAALMGVADVDPFIMGMTQSAGTTAALSVAASAIIIAAASNNFVKALYAYFWSDRRTGVQTLTLLCIFGAAGLVPLFL